MSTGVLLVGVVFWLFKLSVGLAKIELVEPADPPSASGPIPDSPVELAIW